MTSRGALRGFAFSAVAATLLTVATSAYAVAPPNDLCSGAETIPSAGPFPYLTSITADITDATTTGDPPVPSCQTNVVRSIWYQFTPSATGNYTIATCADAPTATTVDDTVIAVYTSSDSTCSGAFTQLAGACDDDSCTTENLQSVLGTTLTAGTTYFILVDQYGGSGNPTAGNTAVQVRVTQNLPPSNDLCDAPLPLPLNTSVQGTLAFASNNFQVSTAAPNCYALPTPPAPIGQTTSTATGRDVVYSFTAPVDGSYSFRAQLAAAGGNLVVHTASSCPTGAGPTTLTTCLGAANRNSNSSVDSATEEVSCVPLTAGSVTYVYVDETTASTTGGAFRISATPCVRETEPNGTPATANAIACGVTGSISPAGDADFFSLGAAPFNARVFAMVDGAAGNLTDFDLRVTTATDTLEYDDANNATRWGSNSANIAGRALTAAPAYLRVNYFSASTAAEPYLLYSVVQAPGVGLGGSSATPESEPNNALTNANAASNSYFSGTISPANETDTFRICAQTGDVIMLNADGDPLRDLTPIDLTAQLLDASGTQLALANDSGSTSSNTSGAGNLSASTPNSPAEAATYRATYTGAYYATVSAGAAGDYLYSIALNCVPGSQISTDLGVSLSATPSSVTPGGTITYTANVTNTGRIANGATVTLSIPSGVSVVAASMAPAGWTCTNTATTATCVFPCFPSGSSSTITFNAQADGCSATVNATATVSAATVDSTPVNNTSSATTTSTTVNCDDGNPCTDDTCAGGCRHAPTAISVSCDDGSACTTGDSCQAGSCTGTTVPCTATDACHVAGTCNPATGLCSNPAAPDGTSCSDGDGCTAADTCQGGTCAGGSPVICFASDPCHSPGTCDPTTGLCSNPIGPNGNACDDGNACTQSDTCQTGVCVGANPVTCAASDQCHVAGTCDPTTGACTNPALADGTSCNDGNPCTQSDSCQAGTCTGANPVTCAPLDQCHSAGVCNPATGTCSNPVAANGTACSDGNGCTQGDTCQAGTCTGGSPVTCTPSDQCHSAGVCNPATGTCSNPSAPNGTACNDANACTQSDTCQAGTCTGANPVTCTASDQCHTAGTCDPTTGACSNPSAPNGTTCNDGNGCTQSDTCQSGACTGTPVSCTASDQCHVAGVCNPATGACSNPTAANGTACNDGNSCTQSDTCQAGACTAGSPVTCTASDQCHSAGVCNPATGMCSNPSAPNGTACNDSNGCTQTDTCQAGTCTGTNPVTCSASDQCHTAGTCDPTTGACSNPSAPNGATCNDGNGCTQSDTCQSGACTGTPVTCTASDQCHVAGVCNPATGACSNPTAANGTACNDGNGCTQSDTCLAGACTGANPVICIASDACHNAGTCDPTTGACSNPNAADGTPCADSNPCNGAEVCMAGVCSAGTAVTCADDGNPCTINERCDAATGSCTSDFAPATTVCRAASGACDVAETCTGTSAACPADGSASDGTACDNGIACDGVARCTAGTCVSGTAVDCDDSDSCTTDTCNEPGGTCTHVMLANCCRSTVDCDDLDPCTVDLCMGTVCSHVPAPACTDGGDAADDAADADAADADAEADGATSDVADVDDAMATDAGDDTIASDAEIDVASTDVETDGAASDIVSTDAADDADSGSGVDAMAETGVDAALEASADAAIDAANDTGSDAAIGRDGSVDARGDVARDGAGDGGTGMMHSGCGCRAAGSTGRSTASIASILFALVALARRARRSGRARGRKPAPTA